MCLRCSVTSKKEAPQSPQAVAVPATIASPCRWITFSWSSLISGSSTRTLDTCEFCNRRLNRSSTGRAKTWNVSPSRHWQKGLAYCTMAVGACLLMPHFRQVGSSFRQPPSQEKHSNLEQRRCKIALQSGLCRNNEIRQVVGLILYSRYKEGHGALQRPKLQDIVTTVTEPRNATSHASHNDMPRFRDGPD